MLRWFIISKPVEPARHRFTHISDTAQVDRAQAEAIAMLHHAGYSAPGRLARHRLIMLAVSGQEVLARLAAGAEGLLVIDGREVPAGREGWPAVRHTVRPLDHRPDFKASRWGK